MTLVVGIDVGNSTTEVVLARVDSHGAAVLGAAAAPTRRAKGEAASLDGAASLVRRVERAAGISAQTAVMAPLRPVRTETVTLPEPAASTGRLRLVAAGTATVGGSGSAVGRPVVLADAEDGRSDRVVVAVPAGTGFAAALEPLRRLDGAGRLAAVVMGDDEAVLLANRLGRGLPVVDEVDLADVLSAERVAVEVGEHGLRRLADPLALVADLDLSDAERGDAARLVAQLRDVTNAVVILRRSRGADDAVPSAGWAEVGLPPPGRQVALVEVAELVRGLPVGAITAYGFPGSEGGAVDDLYAVDLSMVADAVVARVGSLQSRSVALAALRADAPYTDPAAAMSQRLGIEVVTVLSEAVAARAGGLTTPGCAPETVVVDVGGGTIDVVAPGRGVVAAGAGELLTVAVAALTGTTPAAAEWVKRGPAVRVESPHLLLGEDGGRQFLDRPAGREAVGALAVRGPAGLLAFDRRLAPGEWRALRLRCKAEVLGGNVARALRTLDVLPTTVVVVGGPAGDDEVLASVARALPDGVAIGRGDVAGSLGHRYAVAYGLVLLTG